MTPNLDALQDYLREVADRPFVWGAHDCLTFTNEAWHRMHGHGFADDWLGRYLGRSGRPLSRRTLAQVYGHPTLQRALDARLMRWEAVPPRGALVVARANRNRSFDYAMGIANGEKAAFLLAAGVVYLDIDHVAGSWV
jgi:hypothetical protein